MQFVQNSQSPAGLWRPGQQAPSAKETGGATGFARMLDGKLRQAEPGSALAGGAARGGGPVRYSPHSPLLVAASIGAAPGLFSAPVVWSDPTPAAPKGAYRMHYANPRSTFPLRPVPPPATPPPASEHENEDNGLPPAISTYHSSRFQAGVKVGQRQDVNADVEQFHFPHLVQKDGLTYAYFIDHSHGSENDVGLAVSKDGVNFQYQGKVLRKGPEGFDAEMASFPAVQYDGETNTWYMLYEAKADHDDLNQVCLATSPDGRNWTKHGPVIKPGDAGEISAVDVGTPTMFKENGQWHVYFHTLAKDGRVRMGYAHGQDLEHLSVKQGPLLDVDSQGIEGGTVGARSNVVKVGDFYYMAYEVCSPDTDFHRAQWGTNLARAANPGGPWFKMAGGPVLVNDRPGMGMDGPELSLQDGKLYLYYRHGANATARVELSGLGDSSSMYLAHQADASTPTRL